MAQGTVEDFHSKLSEKKCVCDENQHNSRLTSQIRQEVLGDMLWQDGQLLQPGEVFLLQHRDVILLKLSFLTELFEATYCRCWQEISQGLIGDRTCLNSLINLLGCGDSLVAFSACKCLGAVTLKPTVKNEVTDILPDLIRDIKHLISAPVNSLSKGQVNQVVYSLDIFYHAIGYRKEHLSDSRYKIWPCMENERHVDSGPCNTVHCKLIMEEMPSLMDAFIHLSTRWHKQAQVEPQTQSTSESTRYTETPTSREYTKIIMVFLELLHEILKQKLNVPQNPEPTLQEDMSIFLKAFNFVWLPDLPATLLKKTLSIANCIFDHYLELHKVQFKVKAEQVDGCHQDAVPIATEVMTHIAGGWLDRLPYQDVEHGFGGTNIMRCDSHGDFCKGDYPLLRQVVRLGMSASIMVLIQNSDGDARNTTKLCISEMSKCITTKMGLLNETYASTWLLELFGDQDDSLILAMMRALQLHQVLHNNQSKDESCQQRDSDTEQLVADRDTFDTINPHVVFVKFLETVTFDPNLLLDLLISNETDFLEYMVQYIHTVMTDWNGFCQMHINIETITKEDYEDEENEEDDRGLEDIMRKSRIEDSNMDVSVMPSDELEKQDSCDDTSQPLSTLPDNLDAQNGEGFQDIEHIHPTCEDSAIQTISQKAGDQSNQILCRNKHTSDEMRDQKLISGSNDDISHTHSSLSDVSLQNSTESDDFVPSNANQSLDDTMTVLIRLRLSLERMSDKGLFPYNVAPLIRLLERVEDKYEQ